MRERRQETKKKQAWWRVATGDRCWWRNICCDPSLIRLRLSFFFNTTVTRPSLVNASSIQNSTQPNPVTLLTLRLLVPPVSMTPTRRTCLLDPTGSVTRLYWLLTGCVNTPIYGVCECFLCASWRHVCSSHPRWLCYMSAILSFS